MSERNCETCKLRDGLVCKAENRCVNHSMYEPHEDAKDVIGYFTDLNPSPKILDSGNRRQFESGAVRDIQEGKGRCDLLPLDVVAYIVGRNHEDPDAILLCIRDFQKSGNYEFLLSALDAAALKMFDAGETMGATCSNMSLQVAIHFEEGAKKYGENNWQKGIPVHCYIDSAVRHYLKFLRGDKDEPHDRAFCWNILCAIWTCKHKPELNEYGRKELK